MRTAHVGHEVRPWRKVNVRERRTRRDWAEEIKELLDVDYPDAARVVLVCDNLNTHTRGSLYEAFELAEACRLLERLGDSLHAEAR